MSPAAADFDMFARKLDDEWLRERIRATVPAAIDRTEARLAEELEAADPLGAPSGWRDHVRALLGAWPGRLAVAAAAGVLLVVGFAVGRVVTGSRAPIVAVDELPPIPDVPAAPRTALGASATVKPESQEKLGQALAFHGSPDFPRRGLPLLREAVAADPSNDEAQFWLGVALMFSGKWSEAVGPLEEAVRLAPASVQYKQYLLFAYVRAGATDKALRLQTELMRNR